MSHYQTIHEKISVVGVYQHSHFTPKKFRWGQRVLRIDQITLQSDVKDGGIRQRFISVMVGQEVYRLCFNRETEEWWVEEIWIE